LGVLDSNKQQVQGATIAAASGFLYSGLSSSVPEPATALLFAMGLVVLATVKRISASLDHYRDDGRNRTE
jgi:hypothetical protein